MAFNRGTGFNRSKFNSTEFSDVLYSTPVAVSSTEGASIAGKILMAEASAGTLAEGRSIAGMLYYVSAESETVSSEYASAGVLNVMKIRDIVYAIVDLLKADAQVTAYTDMRIYRRKLAINPEFPAITVSKVDGIRDEITNTGGYAHARIQVTAWSDIPGPESGLAEVCTNALHRLTNKTALYGTGGWVRIVSVTDAGGIPDENLEIPLYMEHRDFMVHYDYQ